MKFNCQGTFHVAFHVSVCDLVRRHPVCRIHTAIGYEYVSIRIHGMLALPYYRVYARKRMYLYANKNTAESPLKQAIFAYKCDYTEGVARTKYK